MREIEFRGKRTDGEGWVYGNLARYYKDTCITFDNTDDNWSTGRDSVDVIPETVGQYTGLQDKNGIKIFEGDIVLRCYTESSGNEIRQKMFILFEKGCFLEKRIDSFYRSGLAPNGFNFHEDYQMLETDTKECPKVNGSFEVIGNIHDRPELLERRK
jgi:uncharacterized phage protein (TIGR01671 family)